MKCGVSKKSKCVYKVFLRKELIHSWVGTFKLLVTFYYDIDQPVEHR